MIFSNLAISIITAAVVLGILVLLHEWAHYAAAKACGVTVKVFSIGFGKRLIGFEHNGTDYRISALPLGGYVKMAGDNPMEESSGDPGEFNAHPRWQRFFIVAAGPAMNILLCIALLAGMYKFHYPQPLWLTQAPQIGAVEANSPAAKVGMQAGDRIVALDGHQDPSWEDVLATIAMSPNQKLGLTVERAGAQQHFVITPTAEGTSQIGYAGFAPAEPIILTQVSPGSPAANAGVKIGDDVQSVNGKKPYSQEELHDIIQAGKGAAVQIVVMRDGKQLPFMITPKAISSGAEPQYQIGVISNPVKVISLPLGKAIKQATIDSADNAKLILQLFKKMVEHKVSIKQMDGPIGIVKYSGEAARAPGWTPLIQFMALISINLGIVNLFPIPILDGGLILLLIIEGLIRREISVNWKERIYQASFVFLVLFATIVIFNDITKLHG